MQHHLLELLTEEFPLCFLLLWYQASKLSLELAHDEPRAGITAFNRREVWGTERCDTVRSRWSNPDSNSPVTWRLS